MCVGVSGIVSQYHIRSEELIEVRLGKRCVCERNSDFRYPLSFYGPMVLSSVLRLLNTPRPFHIDGFVVGVRVRPDWLLPVLLEGA